MAETFRDEFAMALAETYDVCRKYVGEGGLSLDNKKTAIECSMNLLVNMVARLPAHERDRVVVVITSKLPCFVATAVKEREISP